jgi:hypothetical protein
LFGGDARASMDAVASMGDVDSRSDMNDVSGTTVALVVCYGIIGGLIHCLRARSDMMWSTRLHYAALAAINAQGTVITDLGSQLGA